MEFIVIACFPGQEQAGIDTGRMVMETAVDVQQMTGIVVLLETQARHIAELPCLVAEAGVSRISIIAIAVIVACCRILHIGLCDRGKVLEIVKAVIGVQGGLHSAFYLRVSVMEWIDEVGLEGKAMRLAGSLILLDIRAAKISSVLVEVLHRIA